VDNSGLYIRGFLSFAEKIPSIIYTIENRELRKKVEEFSKTMKKILETGNFRWLIVKI